MVDMSFVIGAIIALLIGLLIHKVWPAVKAFIPGSALFFINWFAEIVVKAVESELGGKDGEAKREEAFKRINEAMQPLIVFMEKFGYTISAERIYEAIQAAWIKLDLAEIQAGVKIKPPDEHKAIE